MSRAKATMTTALPSTISGKDMRRQDAAMREQAALASARKAEETFLGATIWGVGGVRKPLAEWTAKMARTGAAHARRKANYRVAWYHYWEERANFLLGLAANLPNEMMIGEAYPDDTKVRIMAKNLICAEETARVLQKEAPYAA